MMNSFAQKQGFNIGTKLAAITILLALAAVSISSFISGYTSNAALKSAAFDRLTAVRELKSQQIKAYFSQIEDQLTFLSEDMALAKEMANFQRGVVYINSPEENKASVLKDELLNFYKTSFLSKYQISDQVNQQSIDLEALLPKDYIGLFLQEKYLVNPASLSSLAGEKVFFDAFNNIDNKMQGFRKKFGYVDVFLVEPRNGRIVYSSKRNIDFGTRLYNGPYADSNLGRAVATAMTARPGKIIFADFKSYIPAYGSPAAFAATAIYDKGDLLGVLAVQLSLDGINSIMTSNQSWSEVGLGKSGEAYLVGRDNLLRNQSRFLIEDRERYLELIAKVGLPEDTIERIAKSNSSIGLQKVDTDGTRDALAGNTNTAIFSDYRDVQVLSSYRPLDLSGLDWVIMSEIDRDEALRDADLLIDRLILVASLILAIAVYASYLFSISLTRPLRSLSHSATQLTSGELNTPVKLETTDEIGELARNFEALRLSMIISL